MIKSVIISLLVLFASMRAHGQTISAAETVRNYTVAQKRLLIINTFQFANLISQNNLDKDSLMIMACQITGLPFLLAYDEVMEQTVPVAADYINSGRINEATRLAVKSFGESKIHSLIELALWYLHQPGARKKDLDNADMYITQAAALSKAGNYENWENECNFLRAEYYYQKADTVLSKNLLNAVLSSGLKKGNTPVAARAYQRLGAKIANNDSLKLDFYQKSFSLYTELDSKEKEIELLSEIAECHANDDLALMEDALQRALSLMQTIHFKHVLFVQNRLSYAELLQLNLIKALKYANEALENLEWSVVPFVEGAFYYRKGIVLESLGKNDEALFWFKKSLQTGTQKAHLFWYKALFFAHTLLIQMKRPYESLTLIKNIIDQSPPVTVWEKMQVFSCIGECYEKLHNTQLASENYLSLLAMATSHPSADPNGELCTTYLDIANFYVSLKDKKNAQLFLSQAIKRLSADPDTYAHKYFLLYKMDSLEGNYKSALQNHLLYKLYYDSSIAIEQRKKLDELTFRYAAEKKDQDIKLLTEQAIVQQTELKQNKLEKDIMVAGTLLLLTIVGLLFNQYRLKQRSNAAINKKNLALQRLVEEKEWLLKEVHHRVKNNLHTVISLLESQAAYLENDALKAIENSQHRIYAMSLIHQKLYQAEDVKTIDMSVYLPELIRYLDESFETHYRIQFNLDIEAIHLGVSQAIPIALIINEAVTNSIKYAFPEQRKGNIKISMKYADNQITLLIADNGIGIDESLINPPSESLGLKLIKGLSADINAGISFNNHNGTSITIVFNVDPLSENINLMKMENEKEAYA